MHTDNKVKKQPLLTALYCRISINLIAGKLLSSRACFLLRLTSLIKGIKVKKSPTIFQYITAKFNEATVPNRFVIKKGGKHIPLEMNPEWQEFVDWFDKYLK